MGFCGPLWAAVGRYGPLWTAMGRYVCKAVHGPAPAHARSRGRVSAGETLAWATLWAAMSRYGPLLAAMGR